MHHGFALIRAGSDIQKGQLIGAFLIIASRNLYRVTCITDINKLYALDNTSGIHIHTGNYAFCESHLALLVTTNFVCQLLGGSKIKRPLINGTACNGPHDTLVGDLAEGFDVIDVCNTTRRDHRNMY